MRRNRLPSPTDRIAVGGCAASPLCLGITRDPATVLEAFDRGINTFFLTGDLHWPVYEGLRRGLEMLFARGGGVRDDVVVCGVCYATQPYFFKGPYTELLEHVKGLDRLDVLVGGGAYAQDFDARLPRYEEMAGAGAWGARALGFSFHEREALRNALSEDRIDLGFLRYNPRHPGARRDVFPAVRDGGRARIFAFKSTAGYRSPALLSALGLDDYWVPRKVDHYRYALTHGEVDGLLCAPQTSAELEGLLSALEEGPLSESEEAHMEALASSSLDAYREALVERIAREIA
jgi:hypothetical protein